MSQLCVKVMVDDGSLSIAVLVYVGFKSLDIFDTPNMARTQHSCLIISISNYMSLRIVS